MAPALSNAQQNISRPLANFPPSIWSDRFNSCSINISELESCARQVKVLKEEVKVMLIDISDPLEKIHLINLLCRLGISYHFENEIEDQLSHISKTDFIAYNDHGLHDVALLFRIFRQYNYKISSDIFNKFLGSDGKFKETLNNDVKGMLSLYEAAQLRVHGEDVLNEAVDMTITRLKRLAKESSPHVKKHILNALHQPFHKNVSRLDAKLYISFYQEEESCIQTLLKFAMLDFHLLQSQYIQELSELSSWWKDVNIVPKLPYVRDRLVENYFWAVGMVFEPHYARARNMLTKFMTMTTIVNDIYDAYGTCEELERFTDAVQRWEVSAIGEGPEGMKVVCQTLFDVYEEYENAVTPEGRYFCGAYTRSELVRLCEAYMVKSKWCKQDYKPTFDEYMNHAMASMGIGATATVGFTGMGDVAGIEAFEWLQARPKIFSATSRLVRLVNDMASYEVESKRKHIPTSMECYMVQYGVSKEEAIEKLKGMVDDVWKSLNDEWINPTASVSKPILKLFIDMCRVFDLTYKQDDPYSNPGKVMKDYITLLFIDQMPIQEKGFL